MKRFLITIFILMAGLAIFDYWTNDNSKLKDWTQTYVNDQNLEEIKQEVFTSGPLKNLVKNPLANLTAQGVIEWTNQQRTNNGLSKLSLNQKLSKAAQIKVQDMFAKQYFDHVSPDGKGPAELAKQAGYGYIRVGENLALGNYDNDQKLVEAWMNSPGHRANILNEKFTEIGVYVLKGIYEGEETWLAVQEFGKPASSCPAVSPFLKTQIDSTEKEVDSLQPQIAVFKSELESLAEPETKEEYGAYNQKVSQYNSLVKIFNNKVDSLKKLIGDYNAQIRRYNLCAEN